MRLIAIILLLFFSYTVFSQNCHCPSGQPFCENGTPIKVFLFSNKKSLGICGYLEVKHKDTTYSGIALYKCGENKIIDDWGEIQSCKVRKVADTLLIEELYGLPIGENFNEVSIPFYINKYFFKVNDLQQKGYYRKDIKKYSKAQIRQVLEKYKKLRKENSEHNVAVANMLFWAYVSGSKEAEVYLKSMPEKIGPFDGAIAEEWDDISATYEHWKEKNKRN